MSIYTGWIKHNLPVHFLRKNIVIIAAALILLHVISTETARFIVNYLAVNVTDSIAPKFYTGTPYNYELIHWDEKLKKLIYGIFGAILLFEIILIHIIHLVLAIKKKKSKPTVYITTSIFLLSFPTITNWYISTSCEGPSIFYCSKTLYVFTPIIMSNNPIFIAISLILALSIINIYFRRSETQLFYR